jgi:hypothetical protein
VELAGDTLTLHSRQAAAGTGIYRWRLESGGLRLAKVSDRNRDRVTALVAMPLTFVERHNKPPEVPVGWAAQQVTSPRFGYSLRIPHYWSIDTTGSADQLSGDETRHALPEVAVTAQQLDANTSAVHWGGLVDSKIESNGCVPYDHRRFFVAGMKIRLSVYRDCGAPHLESATFVHGGRGYRIAWRGKSKRPEHDYARFDALLKTLRLEP